jgi:hypothetical protein
LPKPEPPSRALVALSPWLHSLTPVLRAQCPSFQWALNPCETGEHIYPVTSRAPEPSTTLRIDQVLKSIFWLTNCSLLCYYNEGDSFITGLRLFPVSFLAPAKWKDSRHKCHRE